MANKVSNLAIKLQTGSDNTYLATWTFDGKVTVTTSSSSGGIRKGDYVTIRQGATWYNGVRIPSWVFADTWQVYQLKGDRAVLDRNRSGTNRIMSPIKVSNLIGGSGSTTTTTSTVEALDHYAVTWAYDTGDGIWFSGGGSTDTKETYATYSPPSNAIQVKVTVRPISKSRQVNGQDTPYFSGQQASVIYSTSSNPPEVPPSPDVEIDKYTLTATVDNVSDARSDEIEFQVYDMTTLFKSGTATVQACMATFQTGVNAGGSYRVRVRSANIVGSSGRVYSDWTDFTDPMITIPIPPAGIDTIRGASSTSVYLSWPTVNSAETYDIEYTTNVNYFDASSETTTVTGVELNYYTVTGLETGDEYFFRVRAVNEQGESAWTEPVSVVIGKKPTAPTTWSSSTTVVTGNPVILYWVHNAEDGSTEEYAQVEITIGNGEPFVYTIKNELADDEENPDKDKTKSYTVDTSEYAEGTQIKWRVRTSGITLEYGDWSIMRTVDVYAPPTLNLTVTDQNGAQLEVIEGFPFYIKGLAGPSTQEPIGYHVTITADLGYETVDSIGQTLIVNAGDEVYSSYIDSNDPLLLEMDPWNIDLENNADYTLTVIVSMNSGLTATETKQFSVSWEDEAYDIDATVAIDPKTFVAYITPKCMVPPATEGEEATTATDATMSVYRREFDGQFTEIATGIEPEKNTMVTDPHPSLDYARYRVIAISKTTGAVTYYDPPGYPVGCDFAIVQWAEDWVNFDVSEESAETEEPLWSGSMLLLKYNLDLSDANVVDSSLVNYVGRKYPVSYYGTNIGSSSTWTVEIETDDQDTLYALRRLSIWQGDVYVREPSGTGYWANVSVSYSKNHNELTIPVTLSITRVEGGM